MLLTAKAANAACEADGGHLVVIETVEENQTVLALLPTNSGWIGVVDPGNGFVLVTGGAPSFSQWAPGDPNGEGNCVRMLPGNDATDAGNWDDEPCNDTKRSVCEVDGTATIVSPP